MKLFWMLLFIGLIYSVDGIIDWVAVGSAAAVSSAVISGSSLIASLAGPGDSTVAITIEIENWTKYPLVYPMVKLNRGQLKSPPTAVRPGMKEAFIAHKHRNTAYGTYGTASWRISSSSKRAVVMWSCPYNFNHYSNWLAIGLTESGHQSHRDWFNQMYYQSSGWGLNFIREEYYYRSRTISIKDDQFEMTGTMGTSHRTKAKLIFRPLNEEDLAPSLKAAYGRALKRSLQI